MKKSIFYRVIKPSTFSNTNHATLSEARAEIESFSSCDSNHRYWKEQGDLCEIVRVTEIIEAIDESDEPIKIGKSEITVIDEMKVEKAFREYLTNAHPRERVQLTAFSITSVYLIANFRVPRNTRVRTNLFHKATNYATIEGFDCWQVKLNRKSRDAQAMIND